jgi:hypothetical protein
LADNDPTSGLLYPSNWAKGFWIGPGFLIVLDDDLYRVIECDQERHVAGDDLGQHAHGCADLSFTVFARDQTGQDFFTD